MLRRIWKYTLDSHDCLLLMQDRSIVLNVAVQGIDIVLWAIVHPDEPPVRRRFVSVNTGSIIHDELDKGNYIGTVDVDGIVWHIFEAATRYRDATVG